MLVKKPPLGFNTWNTFGENINEKLVMEIADKLVHDGYAKCGYEYVVIDDCWAKRHRDDNGLLVADPEKFPHGMKYLSDYIHSLGLKFGMYSCAGVRTCEDYPSSYGHEFDDANTFASWGVDFLKYDFCYFPQTGDCKNAYHTMRNALNATGRDILFSACNWGVLEPWKWMNSLGVDMYRSTGDIFDNVQSFYDIFSSQVENFNYSGVGCYNDIDMLIVGMYGEGNVSVGKACNAAEYRMHFALWAMSSSPLMIGGDIRKFNDETISLLQNKLILRINQDEEARPIFLISGKADSKTFALGKHLSNGELAIGMFNFSDKKQDKAAVIFTDLGYPEYAKLDIRATDAFTGEDLGAFREYLTTPIESHDCKLFIVKPQRR